MTMRASLFVCFVLFLCFYGSVGQQVLKIGRTSSRTGFFSAFAPGPDKAVAMWEDIVNQRGGIVVGGTKYSVKIVSYNDGSDPELATILYERLVTFDNVSFLIGPFAVLAPAAAEVANRLNVPLIDPYPSFSVVSPVNPYVFHLFYPIDEMPGACAQLFASKGAKTAVIGFQADSELFVPSISATFTRNNITVLPSERFTPDTLRQQMKQWKKQKPDIFIGSASDPILTATLLVEEMVKQKFFPAVTYLYSQPNDPAFRALADWKGVYSFSSASWHYSLNSSDPIFNNSLDFEAEFRRRYNTSTSELDAASAAACVVFTEAILQAGSINRELVRQALGGIDVQTLFGRVSFFANGTTTGTWKCFQVQNDAEKSLMAVFPKNPSLTVVDDIYPGRPPIPKGFYKHDYRLRNGLIGGGVGLFVVLVVVAVVMFLTRHNYHVIFVPKKMRTDEWAT